MSQILKLSAPNFPLFRFEWHPEKKKVYLIRLGVTPVTGEIVEEEVSTHGHALNVVKVWLRGYRTGKAEIQAITPEGRPIANGVIRQLVDG